MSANSIAEKFEVIADAVYEAGQKSEYDRFWDSFQSSDEFINLFSGAGWTNETFRPKKDIILPEKSNAYMMFKSSRINGDFVEILKKLNIKLDFKKVDNAQYAFDDTRFTRLGILDFSEARYLQYTCRANAALEIIDEFILKSDGSQDISNSFGSCTALKSIKFTGVIGSNINFKDSPLNKASIENIVEHLLTTATGKTVTFKKSAVDKAFETSEGANDGSSSTEWISLITPYSNQYNGNWTISLV